jgi:hypothetical protein
MMASSGQKERGSGKKSKPSQQDAKAPKVTSSQMYADQLTVLGLHPEPNFSFVPAHCFFGATSRASPYFDKDCPKKGARRMRLLLASAYLDPNIQRTLRAWNSKFLGEQCEELLLVAEGRSIEELGLFEPDERLDWWHPLYCDFRANMFRSVDCTAPPASRQLWVYSNTNDHVALVRKLRSSNKRLLLNQLSVEPAFMRG